MTDVVVISGTIATGKTSVAEALSDILRDGSTPFAVIDVDWLCQVHPAPEGDPYASGLGFANLAAVWPNYRDAGVQRLVLARVLSDAGDRERYAHALGGAQVSIVRLVVPFDERCRRIVHREADEHWRDSFLVRTEPLARRLEALGLEDFEVSNHGRTPADAAGEIAALLGWS